jgi:NADH dehydrogenase
MKIKKICILGGSGFVGQSLANRLTRDGYDLRVLTRNQTINHHLLLLPTLELVECNIHDQEQLIAQFNGCDAVINLVGILNEHGRDGRGFHYVHAELAEKIVEACRQNGIKRILQMGALNADTETGTSHYLRSKGEAEDIIHTAVADGIAVTSYRPSVIFGPKDDFFNRFAQLLQMSPLVFPLACYGARFAPVYVLDVAEMMARSLGDPDSHGQRYCLCGPKDYTLLDLVRYTAKVKGLKRLIIPLGDTVSRLQATVFDFVPGKPFSTDNYNSAKLDSTCSRNDLSVYDITPTPLESVIPQYLANQFQRARYFEFRSTSQQQ